MNWFLVGFLGTSFAVVVAVCIVVLLARHRLNRHHRVDPRVATGAPLTWVADPRVAARLHRRLTKVGRTATLVLHDHTPPGRRLRRTEPSPIAAAALDLRSQAVAVDAQLSRLAVLAPGARRQPLAELGRAVADLEAATAHLVSVSATARAPSVLTGDGPDITDVRGQLDRLAEAHRELEALDGDAGLSTATRPGTTLPAPPPPAPSRDRR